MTRTIERNDAATESTDETGPSRGPRPYVAATTVAVLALVLGALQALGVGFAAPATDEGEYLTGLSRLMRNTVVAGFVALLVAAGVRRIGDRPRVATVTALVVFGVTALVFAYVQLKVGPLKPSF